MRKKYWSTRTMNTILSRVQLDKEAEDRLVWKDNTTSEFSVKSLCGLLNHNPSMDTIFSFTGI